MQERVGQIWHLKNFYCPNSLGTSWDAKNIFKKIFILLSFWDTAVCLHFWVNFKTPTRWNKTWSFLGHQIFISLLRCIIMNIFYVVEQLFICYWTRSKLRMKKDTTSGKVSLNWEEFSKKSFNTIKHLQKCIEDGVVAELEEKGH